MVMSQYPNGTGDVVVNSDRVIISGGSETALLCSELMSDKVTIGQYLTLQMFFQLITIYQASCGAMFSLQLTACNSTTWLLVMLQYSDLTVSGDTTTVSSTDCSVG